VIKEFATHQLHQYVETFSSHQQCHQVIDEKISDRIIILNDESESRDYSA